MSKSFDRRSFLAGGLALGAGAAVLGSEGGAGASLTNGPGRNGIATGKPVKGGSVTMGIDTEESGFDPTSARWDEGGFLYGRTVFDPIAIVNAQGQVEPYLAQSITSNADFTSFTITLKPGIVFHDGTPLDASALHLNLEKQAISALVGPAFATNIQDVSVSGPMSVTITTKTPVGAVAVLLRTGTDRVRRGARHAERPQRHLAPHRHGTVRVQGVGPQQPHDGDEEPALLAQGLPLPELRSPTSRSSTPTRGRPRSTRARST